MKKILLLTGLIFGILILSYPKLTTANVNGSPGGKTNSPLDGGNCTMCHSGTLNSGQGSFNISSDVPSTGYVPGETYTLTVQGAHPSFTKYGFELTAESFGTKVGGFTITNSSQTKLTNNNNSVTHKSTGTLGSATKTWTVNWTAPPTGNMTVDFYAAGMAANGNNTNDSGDEVYTTTYSVNEEVSVSVAELENNLNIYTNYNNIIIEGEQSLESIEVYDIVGKKIFSSKNTPLPTQINSSEFLTGIYIVNCTDQNGKTIISKIKIK